MNSFQDMNSNTGISPLLEEEEEGNHDPTSAILNELANHSSYCGNVDDDASTFTFHPVDEPELEVIVSRIFSISFTTRQQQLPSPIAVSDEDESSSSNSCEDWFFPHSSSSSSSLGDDEECSTATSPIQLQHLNEGDESDGGETDDDYNHDEEELDDDDDGVDSFESRKRKEEASMDEEQLRKRRRIEEEERIARNKLWKQSLKRSIFQHRPTQLPV